MSSSLSFYVQSWCIARRGPLFSAMFNPLCTVIVTVLAIPLLHEHLYIGSMIGAVAVVVGLYVVLWGKAKDYDDGTRIPAVSVDEASMDHEANIKQPLLTEKLYDEIETV